MAAPPLDPPRTRPSAAPAGPSGAPAVPPGPAPDRGQDILLAVVIAVLIAACLPLSRIYIGVDFARPVVAAVLLSVGLSWVTRRSGGGPVLALIVSALGYCLLVAIAFLPSTLIAGVLPTTSTPGAARDLWLRGMELVQLRPAPTFAEDGLLLLTVSGVWWIAHVVEGLVFRLAAPLRAIGMALVLWTVPLAILPSTGRVWLHAVPMLAAGAALLLTASSTDLTGWGSWVAPIRRPGGRRRNPLVVAGWPVAITAILAGAVLGGMLPGAGDPPWYEVRGTGGTTLTTNPIVSIRSNLVTLSDEPVAQVTSPQPIYLRLTALDVYGENEEWSSEGIRGGDAGGALAFETPMAFFREVDVEIDVQGLPGAVIVPVPYQPSAISGRAAERFQYDPQRATVTLASGEGFDEGDRYDVTAAVPAPPPDLLAAASVTALPSLTALPGGVPAEVSDLARSIVAGAGATTPFDQALAIQQELRTWTYSLDPPQGHGSSAMLNFITERIGYCEQYAGTMAVMLRTLGIPARVAVGFTPGELVDAEAGIYQVRNANAHAWVEVRFDDLGWIAFEPTPRTDGNVLVPDAEDLAPTRLESQIEAEAEAEAEASETPEAPEGDDPVTEAPQAQLPQEDLEGGGASGTGAEDDSAGEGPWLLLVLLLGLGGGAALWVRTRGAGVDAVPAAAVVDAMTRVQRTARGLGLSPRPSETDAEFLNRIAPDSAATDVLTAAVGRARWATTVPAADASAARSAADELCRRLLAGRGPLSRAAVRARARAAAGAAGAAAGLRLRAAAGPDDDAGRGRERLARLLRRRAGRR